ncbi:MAG TPA: cytochrome c oxidase subunit 3 [Candidatus Limnocylindrales bacterium]|nr:cytochrome c oxidase subunit 3 [Candidatus Limnocylindrales bacterium]
MATDSHALTPTEHSPVSGLAHDTRGGISNPVLGMILFLTSEVMFFGGLFAAYFSVRAQSPQGWPPPPFATDNPLEIFPLVGPATILLIISSFTCQFAVGAIRRNDRTGFLRNIGVTVVLGIVFLVMQALDYTILFSKGLSLDAGPFGTTYFTLTGFHGAHVLGGVIMLSVVLYRGMAGQFSARHHDAVEATSLYWHFVDIVWIALFTTLYILPPSRPA